MTNRCIYCNTTDGLTVSDIVPESLTNVKITRKNVCSILHNNVFGSTFEYDVISKLAFLRNHLDITNKENKHAKYDVTVEIDGVEYKRKIQNALELFSGNIYKSKDENYLFGDFEKLKKVAEKRNKEINKIDINNTEVELKVGFSLEVFFSLSMKRLVAKMAYEWLCSLNDINKKYDDFSSIIHFIETGQNDQYVTYVSDVDVYESFSKLCKNGSHSLLAYEDNNNHLQVLINFFGICIFKVNFDDIPPQKIRNKFGFLELQVTTKSVAYKNESFINFTDNLINNVVFIASGQVQIPLPVDMAYRFGIVDIMQQAKNIIGSSTVDEKLVQIALENYKELIHTSIIHIRKLKRFVTEHFSNFTEAKILNPKGTSHDVFFLYYILYLIGKSGNVPEDPDHIDTLINENIDEEKSIILNDTFIDKLKYSLFDDASYPKLLLKGAKLVKDAPYY